MIEKALCEAERAFVATGEDRERFPAQAAEILAEHGLARRVPLASLFALAADALHGPQNDPAMHFGKPPVTIASTEHLTADIYFWQGFETSIHSHGFDGAFTPLSGLSLNRTYDFEELRTLTGKERLGSLTGKTIAWVRPGDLIPIQAGEGFIHRIWHASETVVTLILRTRHPRLMAESGGSNARQFAYLAPALALPAGRHDANTMQRAARLIVAQMASGKGNWESCLRGLGARFTIGQTIELAAAVWPAATRAVEDAYSLLDGS